jgi:hypothetical protein
MNNRSTPNKLRNVDVLKALREHNHNVHATAQSLKVSDAAVFAWLRANNCKRVFMCVETRER